MSVDAKTFRDGMRRLAASVTVLTTRGADGMPCGLTATAVCSVSADPPILLCCMNKGNSSFGTFCDAGYFAVNVLAHDDQALATRFATPMSHAERFVEGGWDTSVTGAPVLKNAVVTFDCKVIGHSDIGSHRIFFGEVHDVRCKDDDVSPLLYALGSYGAFGTAPIAE